MSRTSSSTNNFSNKNKNLKEENHLKLYYPTLPLQFFFFFIIVRWAQSESRSRHDLCLLSTFDSSAECYQYLKIYFGILRQMLL
jgi:hypothetical protein